MLLRPEECRGCVLDPNIGIGFTRPEGTGSNGVLIIGEAPGEDESKDGLPFRPYAQAGAVLERLFRMTRASRQSFGIWNTIGCRPGLKNWLENSPYEAGAVNHCRVHMERVLKQYKPRVILAMGNVALRTMTGMSGEKKGISYLRGYILPALQGYKEEKVLCPDCRGNVRSGCFLCDGTGFYIDYQHPVYNSTYVVPTFHPSFIARGERRMIGVVANDIQLAVSTSNNLLRGIKPERKPVRYITRATLDDARSFLLRAKENLSAVMSYDIETPSSATEDEDKRGTIMEDEDDEDAPPKRYPQDYSMSSEEYAITQIQFSTEPYTGIVFPWEGEYIQIAKEILALEHPKIGWNLWSFDDLRLRANGCVINGFSQDLMWAWHHLQPDLPAGLQFACSFLGADFPWKHMAHDGDMGEYGAADVDMPQRAYKPLMDALDKKGIRRGYERHILRLAPILWSAAEHGIPVNAQKLKAFEDKITLAQAELAEQKIKPKVAGMDLGNVEPKGGFKTLRAPELKSLLATKPVEEIPSIIHRTSEGDVYRYVQKEFVEPQKVYLLDGNLVSAPTAYPVVRWCRQYDFNPGSAKQIMSYMTAKKHPIPTAWKTDKPTTAKEELERLAKKVKDSFYTDILEYRKFDKMISTYCVGWRPKEDGCVHTTWTFRPAIGQLCIAKGTLVEVVRDLRGQTKGIPIEDVKVGDLVYSYDANQRLCLRRVVWSGKTGHKNVVRVRWMGRGHHYAGYLDVTPEHPFRMTDGTYKQAKDLQINDRVMALSRYESAAGYSKLIATGYHSELFDHKFIYEQLTGEHPEHVHHKDFTKANNLPSNLQGMYATDHARYHMQLRWTPERRAAQRKLFLEYHKEGKITHLRGKDNPNWLGLERDWLIEQLWEFKGRPAVMAKAHRIDYETLQKYMRSLDVNWKEIASHFNSNGAYISADLVQQGRLIHEAKGSEAARQFVGLGYYRWKDVQERFGHVPYNHEIFEVVSLPDPVDVYDLEVEETHNFIANEICVHNSSTGPNAQNAPSHVGLADEFRECVEAPAGHKIVEFDYKSFFVITLGFEAKDEQWIRMGRMDIHSYLGAYALHLPERDRLISMPDDELADRLKWIKKNYQHERDYKWKRAVLGYNNGLGYRKLYHQHQEYFSGEKEAKLLLQTLDGQFPIACRWREEIIHQAQRDYRLLSRHGYHRLFHDVLVYWGQGKIEDAIRRGRKVPAVCPLCHQRHENGEEAEQAKAYLAANDAFGHIKDSIIRLSDQDQGPWNKEAYAESWLGRSGFCNTIHDSIVCIMADRLIDEAVPAIYAEMTRPSTILVNEVAPNGLICDVEAKVGQTWKKRGPGSMETISIRTGMSVPN